MTPKRDMTSKTKMTFGTHSEILSQCRCIGESACMHEKMCACCASAEVFCVHKVMICTFALHVQLFRLFQHLPSRSFRPRTLSACSTSRISSDPLTTHGVDKLQNVDLRVSRELAILTDSLAFRSRQAHPDHHSIHDRDHQVGAIVNTKSKRFGKVNLSSSLDSTYINCTESPSIVHRSCVNPHNSRSR